MPPSVAHREFRRVLWGLPMPPSLPTTSRSFFVQLAALRETQQRERANWASLLLKRLKRNRHIFAASHIGRKRPPQAQSMSFFQTLRDLLQVETQNQKFTA